MKLRQKLAVVLASAMVITSVPVVTSAASTNTITRPSTIKEKGESYTDASEAPAVKINFDSFEGTTAHPEEFYLTLTNAEWNKENTAAAIEDIETALATDKAVVAGDVEIKVIDSSRKVLRVKVSKITTETDSVFYGNGTTAIKIPMLVKLTGGDASVAITTEGSNATITEGTLSFATTSTKVADVTVGKATSINKEGKIATITLAEAYAGSMKKDGGNNFALIELNHSNYEFDLPAAVAAGKATEDTLDQYSYVGLGDAISFNKDAKGEYTRYEVEANFTYGFVGATGVPSNSRINVYVSADADHLYVEMPNAMDSKSKGRLELNNLYIKSSVKNLAEGNVTVDVSGNVEKAEDLIVAVNGNYGAKITVADDQAVQILAGETEKVEFTIQEAVEGTFTNGRAIEVKIDNAYFMDAEFTTSEKVDEAKTLAAFKTAISSIKHNDTVLKAGDVITSVEIEDEKVVGFTFKVAGLQTSNKLDKVTFELKVSAGIQEKGEVKLTAESRDFDEAISGVIAEIRSAVEITAEGMVLKTGLMGQKGGQITIKESEAGALNRSETVLVYLPQAKGVTFSTSKDKLPKVTVTEGDLQVSDVKIVSVAKEGSTEAVQALQLTIKRDSSKASTISIADFHIDTDRTVAEGAYHVEIGGKAVTSHKETIELANFITIGTANTEDLVGANGLAKGTSIFVIGESKYTLNGVEKMMDAKSYIQNPGFTMIPVRYVAEAFGVEGNNVLFSKGVVTLFAGNRTIQLTVGSDIAIVNGAKVQLSTKVAAKDGRTYAPVGEIARILGVSCSWDNTTKTATFTNK